MIPSRGIVELNVSIAVSEGEEGILKGDEIKVLIVDPGDAGDGVGAEEGGSQLLEERAREGGGQVEVEGVIEMARYVGGEALEVGGRGADEVDSGDVGNGLAILVDEEIEGDAMLAQVLDVDQW